MIHEQKFIYATTTFDDEIRTLLFEVHDPAFLAQDINKDALEALTRFDWYTAHGDGHPLKNAVVFSYDPIKSLEVYRKMLKENRVQSQPSQDPLFIVYDTSPTASNLFTIFHNVLDVQKYIIALDGLQGTSHMIDFSDPARPTVTPLENEEFPFPDFTLKVFPSTNSALSFICDNNPEEERPELLIDLLNAFNRAKTRF
jgi:hypothetical protein